MTPHNTILLPFFLLLINKHCFLKCPLKYLFLIPLKSQKNYSIQRDKQSRAYTTFDAIVLVSSSMAVYVPTT